MTLSTAWLYLIAAGIFEILWVIFMKYSEGFSKLVPSFITIIAMIFSIYTLSRAVKVLPLGTAYAVWTGIGAFGAAVYGIIYFGESRDIIRMVSLALIIGGVIGLKISYK